MHHENLTSVILTLEHEKNMKVLVQKCILDGYLDTGVATDHRVMRLDKGLFLMVGLEQPRPAHLVPLWRGH